MLGLAQSKSKGKLIAVADIGSADSGVAIFEMGEKMRVVAATREDLPLEERSQDALSAGVIRSLSAAGEKALAQFSGSAQKGRRISACVAIVGAPWTRSLPAEAAAEFPEEAFITENKIGELAKSALSDQKGFDRSKLFEASVVRVLLNGYPTGEPEGKRAEEIRVRALLSECDPKIKAGAESALAALFPGTPISWRSSARATLSLLRKSGADSCLVVNVGAEAIDLLVVMKGDLTERLLVPTGVREIVSSIAKEKPVEETLALLEMLEKDQCESGACDELESAIARQEPELAQKLGETLAKLSVARKLPEDLVIIAPAQLLSWLSRFFCRIDFTQFTVTTRPFAPRPLPGISEVPDDPRISSDSGLTLACALVNIES